MPVAEQLYMSGQYSNEEIADILGLHTNTISNWVTEGSWKLLKGAGDSARGQIVNNTLLRIQKLTETVEGENPAKNADEILKLTKVVESFSPNKLSVSSQIETMKQFMSYLYEQDHQLAKMINDYSREFVQTCINNAIQQ